MSNKDLSPEVLLRRELRAKQKALISKWETVKQILENLARKSESLDYLDLEKDYELLNLEGRYLPEGFTQWPWHCIWNGYGSGYSQSKNLGACGYVDSNTNKGVGKSLLRIFAGPNVEGNQGICRSKRVELDLYCTKHRDEIANASPLTISNFYSPPMICKSKEEIKEIILSQLVKERSEEKVGVNKHIQRLNLELESIEGDLSRVRDQLAGIESSLSRKKLPENTRLSIYAKHDYKCANCGVDLRLVKPHIDHIIPIAKGGPDTLENLQALCQNCNLKKGAR
jgi:5-methylcytosine-specific restriction endonuclease McrA